MSKFVGQYLLFARLKWSVCAPSPGFSHTSATEGSPCGRRELWDAGFTLTLASLMLIPDPLYPACSTLWISRLQRNQLRHPLCFCGDLGSMKTFSPAVFFIPASSDPFKFAIWNYFLKVRVGSFFKGRHEGTSLVARWQRILQAMQETRVQSLSRKIPHTAEQLSPYSTTIEPVI